MELIAEIKVIADQLRNSYGFTDSQLRQLIMDEHSVPATVFSGDQSPLRALVTYLHDTDGYDFPHIGKILKRSYRATWGSYLKEGIVIEKCHISIPMSIFNDELSIMESVVVYLKEHYQLKFSDMALLLKKNQRTVWTTWHRALEKAHENTKK